MSKDLASEWLPVSDMPAVSASDSQSAESPPQPERWFDLQQKSEKADTELIRRRFLCRGGGLLLVGQTGVGKSSFSRQMALHFALGEPFVGLHPTRPLRSLIIQAENDDCDEAEMCRGVVLGSGFAPERLQEAASIIFHYREQSRSGLEFFTDTVEPLLNQVNPDLLWIDPLLAYLGGDQNKQEVVGGWLRNQLNPLLTKYNCGAVLVHHTAKLSLQKLKEGWATSDFGYLGAGSAEFANWSRAIMCILSTGTPGLYELHAPKRGMRLRWTCSDKVTPATLRCICHSRKEGEICWHDGSEEEGKSLEQSRGKKGKPIPTVDQFVELLPRLEAVKDPREALRTAGEIRNAFATKGWKRDSYAGVCDEAVRQGVSALVQEGRGNRTKLYGRPEVVRAYKAGCDPKKGPEWDERAQSA